MPRNYTTLEFPAVEQPGGALRAFLVVYHGQRTRIVDVREGQEVTFGRSRQATVEESRTRASRGSTPPSCGATAPSTRATSAAATARAATGCRSPASSGSPPATS